uniref:Uncharacterized protein n=1 Tax=Tanacetum cinerariifolium TaxID=118510 RepID=A0A6L2M2I8_TANCI|nr:hypothetical protein [Tanacetum cinerariifolium]
MFDDGFGGFLLGSSNTEKEKRNIRVINDVMMQLSFKEKELDRDAGFVDVVGSGVESFGLSHDESFGVDDLDLNLNEQVRTQEPIVKEVRTQEPTVQDVVLKDYVSPGEDAKQSNGQKDESTPSDGQFFSNDEEIDTAYETEYGVSLVKMQVQIMMMMKMKIFLLMRKIKLWSPMLMSIGLVLAWMFLLTTLVSHPQTGPRRNTCPET